MTQRFERIKAIVKADFLIRFRRPSTAVIFLLLCIAAYLWIPDPSTGRALIQIKEQRALYNSTALALATSSLFTILIGLFGYYMLSNTIRRDVQTRTGYVLASTTMRNSEYLVGKFLGNFVFLLAITIGFMISSMIMQVIRGEAPLEPSYFLAYYLVIVPPILVFLAVVSLVFESIRFLSGKFGDLLYFFVWIFLIAFAGVTTSKSASYPNPASYVDYYGMGFLLEQTHALAGSDGISLGSSEFDTKRPPIVIEAYPFKGKWIVPRLISTLSPLPLLLIALLFFHRFNPDRVKTTGSKVRHNIVQRINNLLKPLTRRATSFISALSRIAPSGNSSFLRSVTAEALVTFQIYPIGVVLILVFGSLSIFMPVDSLQAGLLPVIFAGMGLVLADLATREKGAGTLGMLFAMPRLKSNFVWWKFATALMVAFCFTGLAIVKIGLVYPAGAVAVICATILIAACATALGLMSSNPKAFTVLFLMFLYLVMNDKGENAWLDFAGWYHLATPIILSKYLAIAAVFLSSAHLFHRWQLHRNF